MSSSLQTTLRLSRNSNQDRNENNTLHVQNGAFRYRSNGKRPAPRGYFALSYPSLFFFVDVGYPSLWLVAFRNTPLTKYAYHISEGNLW